MNGEHPSKEKLQRYHDRDRDLTELEAAELRQHVRTCAQCESELDALERLADMLRWSTDDAAAAADADFTRMFTEIERAVAQPSSGAPAGAQRGAVVPLHSKSGGAPRWLYRAAPTLGAMALAAAAVLMVYRPDTVPPDAPDEGQPQLASLDAAHHSEIVAVKFGTNAGQVFGIPLADGSSVPVVWIDDFDEEE